SERAHKKATSCRGRGRPHPGGGGSRPGRRHGGRADLDPPYCHRQRLANFRSGLYSSRAPERLTTSPHLPNSPRITSPNPSGVPPAGWSPIIAKRSLNVCDAIALLIAALSLSMIGRGTPAGAMTPLQVGAA